jgi:hypothetical protein
VKEVSLPAPVEDAHRESFRAALATILELPLDAMPDLGEEPDPAIGWTISRWLGGLGLGLVPVADARSFAWPGPWLARIRPPVGSPRFVVMYGVPSGVVWDPAGDGVIASDRIADGFLVAAADIALARPPRPEPPRSVGILEQIWVAPAAGKPAESFETVRALAGEGLEGDRHTLGKGTFPSGLPGSALTLIEAEVCESFDPPLSAHEHRRNLVTRGIDLNRLVGSEFTIGTLRCRGVRLCEPCTIVDGYASRAILRALVLAAASAPTSSQRANSTSAARSPRSSITESTPARVARDSTSQGTERSVFQPRPQRGASNYGSWETTVEAIDTRALPRHTISTCEKSATEVTGRRARRVGCSGFGAGRWSGRNVA